jgi:DNA mismatch repair protein MutS
MSSKTTPMVRQYLEIKASCPDAILLFRMGDFYEMFFEDARTAARELEITLTTRNRNDPDPMPMCGVPHHAAAGYIAKLIGKGYKVAVCDQVEDAALAKGLVRREVVQVLTPGMVVDDRFLDAKANTYAASVVRIGKKFGFACMDVSTGEFRATETAAFPSLVQEFLRTGAKELVLPVCLKEDPGLAPLREAAFGAAISHAPDEGFDSRGGYATLREQFGTQSLEGFGLENMPAAIAAAGGLLAYVRAAQKTALAHVSKISPYRLDGFLWLDENTTRNLELFETLGAGRRDGSLLGVLDQTVTPMGARLLRHWMRYPLLDVEEINARLDAVEEAKENPLARDAIREALGGVHDLERLRTRVALGRANARDLLAVRASLEALPALLDELRVFNSPFLADPEVLRDNLLDVVALIEASIDENAPLGLKEGGIIKRGYNAQLDELRELAGDAKDFIARMEAKEREKTKINSLKVGYNRVFGYYIEVSKALSDSVPPGYHRKQTLVNAERYITDELKEYETKVLGAEERACHLEYDIFLDTLERVRAEGGRLERVSALLARADALTALAHVADHNGYTRPEVGEGGLLELRECRHPVVERMLPPGRFVANDIVMDMEERQILIITGPNMAGKSTVLRQCALAVILAQMGSFVPAAKAKTGTVDRIFTRVGALDNLSAGQSTFMVEMQETANILNNATPRSLVVLDEIGRGTSTFDGMALAWAVAEYLHNLGGQGVKTLFATHYHELTGLSDLFPRVVNHNAAVSEWNGEILFLHRLEPGGASKSYGIAVARLAGIPEGVLRRARQVLARIEDVDTLRVRRDRRVKDPGGAGGIQPSLFPTPQEMVAQTLSGLDIDSMSPQDALNTLRAFQRKACPGGGA